MKIVTSCFFLIISLLASAQVDTTLHVACQKRDYNMTRFDKEIYDKNKNRRDYCFETETENIRQFYAERQGYIEERSNKKKQFDVQTTYWEQTLELKKILYTIGDCIVGKIRYYDPQGNLTQEIDADAPFKKDIYWVGDFILQQHGVDIFVRETKDEKYYRLINRTESVPHPYYQVHCADKDGRHVYYRIDATTEEVLYNEVGDEIIVDKGDPNQAFYDAQKKEKSKKKGFFGW